MSKSPRFRILVAEDEPDMLGLILSSLKKADFETFGAGNGSQALATIRQEKPDLVVLDLMMPGISGLDVCREMKKEPALAAIPIVILTARAEEVDRIVGLELGADDYMTKPFSPRELILRIQGILRRATSAPVSAGPEEELKHGAITVRPARCEVLVEGEVLDLTATEFKLLVTLLERRGRVQSRDTLLNDVWGYESVIESRTVDTHIRRLREKLGPAAETIETIRGFGYRMVDPAP